MMFKPLYLFTFFCCSIQASEKAVSNVNNITVTQAQTPQNPTIILVKQSGKKSRIIKLQPQQDPDDAVAEAGCCCFFKVKN